MRSVIRRLIARRRQPVVAYDPAAPRESAAPEALWVVLRLGTSGSQPAEVETLRHALDRLSAIVPPERTIVVAMRPDAAALTTALGGRGGVAPLLQPRDAGSAPEILLPVYTIVQRDPRGIIAVLTVRDAAHDGDVPERVREVAAFLREHPRWLVLLGADPAGVVPGRRWVLPAQVLGCLDSGPVWRVQRFLDDPGPETARVCLKSGALWDTGILLGTAVEFVDLARGFLPALHHRLPYALPVIGTPSETAVMRRLYTGLARTEFYESVLEPAAPGLAITRLAAVGRVGGEPSASSASRSTSPGNVGR